MSDAWRTLARGRGVREPQVDQRCDVARALLRQENVLRLQVCAHSAGYMHCLLGTSESHHFLPLSAPWTACSAWGDLQFSLEQSVVLPALYGSYPVATAFSRGKL